ncbi:hypothetical protein [Bacillus subtilis]|uniref:hypothetical protein n=1 Tax=Bacillus subtilis TaxID=1423 RepID=UPI00397F1347
MNKLLMMTNDIRNRAQEAQEKGAVSIEYLAIALVVVVVIGIAIAAADGAGETLSTQFDKAISNIFGGE